MTAKQEAQGAGSLLSRILSSRHAVKRTFEQRQRDVQAEQAAAAKRGAALRGGGSTAPQPGASAEPAQPAVSTATALSDRNPTGAAGATAAPARCAPPATQLPLFRSGTFYSAKRLQQVCGLSMGSNEEGVLRTAGLAAVPGLRLRFLACAPAAALALR